MTGRGLMHCLATACVIALCGCAAPDAKSLYEWEGYQANLYQNLRTPQADVQAQIAAMEKDLGKIQAKAGAAPPGYQAHLGYLHLAAGNDDKAIACLQAETAAFPEFGTYMKLLLSKYTKK